MYAVTRKNRTLSVKKFALLNCLSKDNCFIKTSFYLCSQTLSIVVCFPYNLNVGTGFAYKTYLT